MSAQNGLTSPVAAQDPQMTCPSHMRDPDRCGALIRCPYNDQHFADLQQVAEHLRQCRRDYCKKYVNSIEFIRCPYNSRHHIPKIEFNLHKKMCGDNDSNYSKIVQDLNRQAVPIFDDGPVSAASSSDSEDDSDASDSSEDSTSSSSDEEEEAGDCRRYGKETV